MSPERLLINGMIPFILKMEEELSVMVPKSNGLIMYQKVLLNLVNFHLNLEELHQLPLQVKSIHGMA